MSMLITVSDLRRGGGVAHFYERVTPYLPGDTRMFVIGRRLEEHGLLSAGARLSRDGAGLWRELGADERGVLIVNPSLDAKSLVRDGLAVQAAKARGRQVIVFVRGWQDGTERALDGRLGRAFAASFFAADSFIVLAHRFRTALRRWGYHGPIHTATTAVADDALGAADAGAALVRHDGPPHVLFLSRILVTKGVYEALEAVRMVQRRGVELRMSVVGDGPDLAGAARYVNERGVQCVRFLGDVRGEEKHRLMAASDVYLFPSYREGMPATVLEAMAYGMGVITSRVGGVGDFFEDGVHGFVTPDVRPWVLAERLEALVGNADLRVRLGLQAQAFARLHFTPRRAADRLLAVVAQVRDTPAGVIAPDTDWFAGAGAGADHWVEAAR